jgi:DNA-directed RNA polymerase subunit RPC12/RpoP
MAKGKKGEAYICSTCGVSASGKGHLCNPVRAEKVTVCKYCGRLADNPRHVCQPMVVNIKYACGNCGRVSTSRSHLCNPQPLAKASKKSVKIKVK